MSERKRPPASVRKSVKRKEKDKPKRPLSTYNFFFKEQRQKIIKAMYCLDESNRKKIDPNLTPDLVKKLKRDNGNVSFEEIGKIIGSRWRAARGSPARVSHYAELAKADAERYAKDMEMHNQRKEQMSHSVEISPDARYTTYVPGQNMHYHMQYQHQGINVYPSGMHYGHRDYNNGYQTNTYVSNGFGPSPMTGSYSAYHRSDTPYIVYRRNHNVNNMLEQNSNDMITHNTSGNFSLHGHPMPMSNYQAPPREHASYAHEQQFNTRYPYCQAHPVQEPEFRHDAYYSDNRGF